LRSFMFVYWFCGFVVDLTAWYFDAHTYAAHQNDAPT